MRHLRDRLGDRRLAWCTGERAGLGATPVPRATVLGWFREGPGAADAERIGVRHLIVTDVAAEGLDLQRAARVIHYDLPWTPMRLDQREGRAVRLGSLHRQVEVVRFRLPRALERALRVEHSLEAEEPAAGCRGAGTGWPATLAMADRAGRGSGAGQAAAGVAVARTPPAGVLVGFSIHAPCNGADTRLAFVLLWIDPDGTATESEDVVAARLSAAADADGGEPDEARLRDALWRFWRSRFVRGSRCAGRTGGPRRPGAPRLARSPRSSRTAFARRRAAAMRRRSTAWSARSGSWPRGHTAGEEVLLERLAELSPAELARAAGALPAPSPRWGAVEARLEGVVLFVPD